MKTWNCLHQHSDMSLMDGLSKPNQIAERAVECGFQAVALCDHGSVSGVPAFLDACENVCKCGHQKKIHDSGGPCQKTSCRCEKFERYELKAIAGCEFYICQQNAAVKGVENGSLTHLCVLAKGQQGWKNLVKAVSASNHPDHFYKKPRLSVEQIAAFGDGEFIAFSGHPGSALCDACFTDRKRAYGSPTYEAAKALVRPDWKEVVTAAIRKHVELFGTGNFYVEIQLVDQENMPAALVAARILRHCTKEVGVPCLATADAHYPRKEDVFDHRVLLCAALNTTMAQVAAKAEAGEDVALGGFFRSSNYYIPSQEEMTVLHKDNPDELASSLEIAAKCETPSVASKPMLPTFECPDGLTPDQHLWDECEKGFVKKVPKGSEAKHRERLNMEMGVLTDAGLSSYFLIKQDLIRHARETLKRKTGAGRGSAAGCLVSYLTGITRVDPIRYNLLFGRFYSAARKGALPDIDSDFPIGCRDQVIEYAKRKYGEDKVCQMATFSRMQGRGALKDVLRAHGRCDFEEMNRVTSFIPDEAAIADELQEMIEETGEASIIRWALENNPEPLKEWCSLNDNGEPEGPLSMEFAQAMRLEGTKRSMGKHASGVIISSHRLADLVPMVYDKSASSGGQMVSVDMRDAERMGLVKVDLLSLRTLNCIEDSEHVIRTGRLPE